MLEFLPRPVVGAFAVLGVVIQEIGQCSCADQVSNYASVPGIQVDGPDTVFTKDTATFEVVNQGLGHGKPCPQEANFEFDSQAVPIHNPKTHRLSNGDCVVDRVFASVSYGSADEIHVKVELSADAGATRALGSRILHVVDRPKPTTSTPVSQPTTSTPAPSPSSPSQAGGGAGSSTPSSYCPTAGSAGGGFTAPESCPLTGHGVGITTGLFTKSALTFNYPDVAVAQDAVSSSDADSVRIFPQANGGSRFDSPTTVSLGVGADPVDLLGADLNKDGAPDIAVAEAKHGNDSTANPYDDVALLLNDPANVGSFTVNHVAGEPGITGLASGDVDQDGYIDLVTANSGGSLDGATVLFNKGSTAPGTFLAPDDISEASGSNADAVGVADFNGDGLPDIAIANGGDPNTNYGNSSVTVVRNKGVADPNFPTTFDTPQAITTYTGHLPIALVVGDLDGDGKPDIVVANHVDNTISVLHNTTVTNSTTFTFTQTILPGVSGDSSGHNPIDVAIGDVDGDGRKDIVVANAQSNNVSVYHQAVGGAFGTPDHLSAGTLPFGIAAGDLDQDGRADIEVANYGPDGYSPGSTAGPGTATIYRTTGAHMRRALLRAAPVAKLAASTRGRRTLTVKGKPVLVPVSLGRTSYGSDGSGHLRGALAVGTLNARVAGSPAARRHAPAGANDILHSHFVARLDVDRWLLPAAGNPITMRGYLLAQSTRHPKLLACLRIGFIPGAQPYERVRLIGGTGRLGVLRMVTNLSLLSLDVAPPAGTPKSTMKMTVGYRPHQLGLPRQCRALRSELKATTPGKHRQP